MSELEYWCYSDKTKKYPSYRMWKLDYIMAGDFSYSYKKYKRWLRWQKIKDFFRRKKKMTEQEEPKCARCGSKKLSYGEREVDPSRYHGFRFINHITCLECGNTFIRS